MVDLREIHSLTDFQRHAKAHVDRIRASGQPLVLTVNGKAAVVVQDAESYQRLLELAERVATIEGIQRGLEDADAGRVRGVGEAFDEIGAAKNIPPRG